MSLYLHSIYEKFNTKIYHETPQTVGKIRHENIETGTYSTARRFIMGLEVSSEKYHIMGKIDVYDRESKALIERKTRIKRIHDGYKCQLYAQYFCLKEMGYPVEKLFIHSLEDNKRYEVNVPGEYEESKFQSILDAMRSFTPQSLLDHSCSQCRGNIYSNLSW
ncbi:MAG: type V CRISPR-associated protein Cas4 [Candidatus Wildermuthbacteria bacterium RIFCSPHIGHO2_01_FULL_45_20]|uniref:Type V CRISPR-associated protein Cas4 n=1 Tax=Candidatus Wildermuthbacteria bacterium RIFCSPHIGHO2_02_FULL_45_25 TaxID=1802450 RepID=A0A1G2R544_9BACT|nr:MAG: type V CRISPR-associated protein Cas4 [Candidatus Wildermuthbacteria bacterium RIFCSPHIGHO2_01_FULL_45_20]OHA67933.1 MAG: type V CRISPR-associated protein Cas4 [Candidatus Wildermuthbacteria bacterium RIFCSPHIGHO2_02_FULL_45_25]